MAEPTLKPGETRTLTIDTRRTSAAEGRELQKELSRLAADVSRSGVSVTRKSDSVTFDVSKLDEAERKALGAKLRAFSGGLRPELGLTLAAAEGDPHLSHGDNDGWF
jgi:hypothetical protein